MINFRASIKLALSLILIIGVALGITVPSAMAAECDCKINTPCEVQCVFELQPGTSCTISQPNIELLFTIQNLTNVRGKYGLTPIGAGAGAQSFLEPNTQEFPRFSVGEGFGGITVSNLKTPEGGTELGYIVEKR